MKLLRLRYVLEVFRHDNHISKTAEALHTSQPGISKHIQMLEDELGFKIFTRKRNRIVGLTDPGEEVIAIAQRVLNDIDSLKRLGEEVSAREGGALTIATTHTQARYVLPDIIARFIKRHPKVDINLRQGNPTQICEMVEAGDADIAIGTETTRPFPTLVRLDCFPLERCIIAKVGHPLLKVRKLSLQDIARYPIITHDPSFSGRWKVLDAFTQAGITPKIIFGAVDADVGKTYVELGLGISVVTTVSYNRRKDTGLRAIAAGHLFAPSMTAVSLRANNYLRNYTYDLIRMLSPKLTRDVVMSAMQSARGAKVATK
ncbi:LysR substrate-binding domain-containing protein [Bordetella sp. BOR01]|uniref:LysR substrate-binding domain-containing protein n=1 Tax=Bordetella sp. BOR01 TaxID=2854779 RepID=UPI001C43ACBF|nr:LysR substrate-binding domain-containing protein [Bordetella sp. BOR01]MBV7483797.1 LysR family transcriptional regulator [Bordetella sp. BOR01]